MLSTADYDYALAARADRATSSRAARCEPIAGPGSGHGSLSHRTFRDLAQIIPPGDVLVLNTTRVMRVRLLGTRKRVGRARGSSSSSRWAMGDSKRSSGPGASSRQDASSRCPPSCRRRSSRSPTAARGSCASTPPCRSMTRSTATDTSAAPYVTRPDTGSMQTATRPCTRMSGGRSRRPTAGLHFTPEAARRLARHGVERATSCLHVGAGTFKPVETERSGTPRDARGVVLRVTRDGRRRCTPPGRDRRVCGRSGTTTAGHWRAPRSRTERGRRHRRDRLFIRPPFHWHAVDRLITIFICPVRRFVMLVAALPATISPCARIGRPWTRAIDSFRTANAMLVV